MNQIGNLGFRYDATHTRTGQIELDRPHSRMKSKNLQKPKIYRSREIDFLYLHNHYRVLTFWEKVSKLIQYFGNVQKKNSIYYCTDYVERTYLSFREKVTQKS